MHSNMHSTHALFHWSGLRADGARHGQNQWMGDHRHFLLFSRLHRGRECAEAILFGVRQSGRAVGGLQCIYKGVQCTEYMECIRSVAAQRQIVYEFPGRSQGMVHDLGHFGAFVYVLSTALFIRFQFPFSSYPFR